VKKPAPDIQLSKTDWYCQKCRPKMHHSVVKVPLEVSTYAQNQGRWKICSSSGSRLSSQMLVLHSELHSSNNGQPRN
jgi:hypothetical protein